MSTCTPAPARATATATVTATATPTPLTWGPKALPVPYAARWTGEATSVAGLRVKPDGSGLTYERETPRDRDRHGVLWARIGEAPGAGRPDYRAMHAYRQREAVFGLRCQVCGGPAARTARGWLFLVPAHDSPQSPERETGRDAEGTLTTKPPVCRPCAELAIRLCPHLGEPLLIHSRKPRVWGVFGGYCTPAEDGRTLRASQDAYHPYGAAGSPWFLASQAVLELTRCS
jgi:hypothetical protein